MDSPKRNEKTGAKVTHYLGDGDSKGFTWANYAVDWPMTKLECINHVAKRMGSRLRNRRKFNKLGGKGKLTETAINKIQGYYNSIIHHNLGDASLMNQKVNAMRKHIGSSNGNPDHDDCDPEMYNYMLSHAKGEDYDHDDH